MVKIKGQSPNNSKRIKTPETPLVSSNKQSPLFSFEFVDDQFGIAQCDKDERSGLIDTLRIMGQLTWEDLELGRRHANGKEKIQIGQIKGRKPRIITPDVEHVYAFRFHGKKPMVGLRSDRIFYIIWLDRSFTLYDH